MTNSSVIESARKVARDQFQLEELRPAQEKALLALAEGRDVLTIWPTGAGKSLCYQLPAMMRDGLTLVVSPLVALMADQVGKAEKLGLPFTFINSSLDKTERESRQRRLNDFKLLYVTPERFRKEEFWAALKGVKISLLAVDEAHCISQWGHDFRPDYSRLGEIRAKLGSPQTIALTATATVKVQQDIARQLNLASPEILLEGVDRPNLFLGVHDLYGEDTKIEKVTEFVRATPGPIIVYFSLITTLQKVSHALQKLKIRHLTYHGDLPPQYRTQNQNDFLADRERIILATPAFGLGVDKPDVRGLLHFELPGSVEAYYQEVGRAGRDGLPSQCWLLYDQDDIEKQMEFIKWATPETSYIRHVFDYLKKNASTLGSMEMDDLRAQFSFKNKRDYRLETALGLLERWGAIEYPNRDLKKLVVLGEPDPLLLDEKLMVERRKHLQMNLLSLVEWVNVKDCRKILLYKYFGYDLVKPCGQCDNCQNESLDEISGAE
jgi:ATP-dependent DNA helicase RecQ